MTLVEGDLADKDLLTRVIGEEQIDTVFHLASQVEVGVAASHPQLTFETNVRGTYQLLESVRLADSTVRAVVVASSDKAYGSYPRGKMPYRETYPLIPRFPYDVSKACADMIAQSYATELYRLPILITRFSNIYGPGQLNFSAVMPDAIRACLGYGKFVPRGDGTQVRDFLYVKDVVELYLAMAEALAQRPERLRKCDGRRPKFSGECRPRRNRPLALAFPGNGPGKSFGFFQLGTRPLQSPSQGEISLGDPSDS